MNHPLKRLALTFAALAAAIVTPAQAADSAPALAVRAILAPYASPAAEPPPAWNRGVFARPVVSLIDRWKQARPDEEPDALSDGDWFCQCQDWDARAFRVTRITTANLTASTAEVSVTFTLAAGQSRSARYVMKREGGRWLVDDMFDASMPRGLKAALRETIAEDEALRRQGSQ